jgi:Ca2+-binding EF-hand superfamily protein
MHDEDKNGALDQSELQSSFVKKPSPDILITVRLGVKDANAKQFEFRRLSDFGKEFTETAALASLTFGGSQMEFVPPSAAASWNPVAASSTPAETLKALFKQSDRDNNGYIDAQEINQMRSYASIFSELDKDHDQKLFPAEFVDRLAPLATAANRQCQLTIVEGGFDLFQGLDVDEDNRLSTREMQAIAQRASQWDRNGDKQVTQDELPQRFRLSMTQGQLNNPNGRNVVQRRQIVSNRNKPARTTGPDWFRSMDRNSDGDVSRREFLGNEAAFKTFDHDGNGLIDAQEAK